MILDPMPPAAQDTHVDATLRGLLGGMSVFTMLMTIPQVLTIWVGHQAAGVDLSVSRSTAKRNARQVHGKGASRKA
jgi:hypothetical protein